jgi:hypothetical protein
MIRRSIPHQSRCIAKLSVGDDEEDKDDKGGMSNAIAGVIGAMVTLGVVALVGAVAFIIMRRRKTTGHADEKGSVRSGSTDGNMAKVWTRK